MTRRRILALLLVAATVVIAQQTFRQNRWARYEHEMQDPIDDPPDAWDSTEFAFARLRFRSPRDSYFRRFLRWGTDSNKSERLFMKAIRRLTLAQADHLLAGKELGTGSMRPKVEAAADFVRSGSGEQRAIIAELAAGLPALRGEAGTTIERN